MIGIEGCFVDASAWLALYHPNDTYHKDARRLSSKLDNWNLFVSDGMIGETYSLLRKRLGFQHASIFLHHVTNEGNKSIQIVESDQDLRAKTTKLLEKYSDHKISYFDAQAVAIMEKHNIDHIFTFDHHFDIMGVKRLY